MNMNFLRRPYFRSEADGHGSMTRDAPDNGSGCLAKTPKTPTKDPRDFAPPPPTDSLPKDHWSNSTQSKNQHMDTRSPFRGGGGMQVHAVPDGERATVNGQQLPWAYEYSE